MKSFWQLSLVAVCVLAEPAFAQKLVDPNAVAPQYREAAEKRRAEQIRQMECRHKVDVAKRTAAGSDGGNQPMSGRWSQSDDGCHPSLTADRGGPHAKFTRTSFRAEP